MIYYLVPFFLFFFKITVIHGLNESCSRNSDCATVNAICKNDICSCDDISKAYNNDTQCLPYATEYGAICYEDEQCEWLGDNSVCSHNRCTCAENFRWYKGKCQGYVDKGGNCSSDNVECYNGYDMLSLSCSSEGICECSTDYYDRGYDCRSSSKVLGECALDMDCHSSLLKCALGKCTLQSIFEGGYHNLKVEQEYKEKVFIYNKEMSCNSDDDCRDMANSLCDISNKTCGCNSETHYLYEGNCVQGLSHCDDDSDCTQISDNTMCFKKSTCICKQGFFFKSGVCIAELGMPDSTYEEDSSCPIKPGKLINSTCYCKNYWFNDESNRNCIKTTIQTTNSCLTNEWCNVMGPYSFCNSTSSTCQCLSIANFNETSYYCDLVSHNFTDICLKDGECDINEQCIDEKCECIDNFSRNEDKICVPNVGASCEIVSCAHIENAYCLGGVCTCADDYVGKEVRCLKMADGLEDPCEQEEQCQKIEHTVCGVSDYEYDTNDTLRCVCEEGYTDVNNMCHKNKKYGDPCMTEAECTLVLNRSYKCRNSQCQCDVGSTLKNGYCTSSGNVIVGGYLLLLALLVKVLVIK